MIPTTPCQNALNPSGQTSASGEHARPGCRVWRPAKSIFRRGRRKPHPGRVYSPAGRVVETWLPAFTCTASSLRVLVPVLLLLSAFSSARAEFAGPEPTAITTYKKAAQGDLALHIFQPEAPATAPRPAIVFFFGGGWVNGTPVQFYPECAFLASKGWVAISAEYRIRTKHKTSPFESVADGKSAIRWIRSHAAELGIDPNRIVAAGASAGGQVAAAAATLPGLDDPADDLKLSPRPNALVLLYPVIDNGPGGYGSKEIGSRYKEFSPMHNITPAVPPTLVFLGTKDHLIPVATAKEFQSRIQKAGGRCELELIDGAGHPIFSYKDTNPPLRDTILAKSLAFLNSLSLSQK